MRKLQKLESRLNEGTASPKECVNAAEDLKSKYNKQLLNNQEKNESKYSTHGRNTTIKTMQAGIKQADKLIGKCTPMIETK